MRSGRAGQVPEQNKGSGYGAGTPNTFTDGSCFFNGDLSTSTMGKKERRTEHEHYGEGGELSINTMGKEENRARASWRPVTTSMSLAPSVHPCAFCFETRSEDEKQESEGR